MSSERRVDISVLCHNAQILVNLAAPFTKFTKALDKFRKWESPILCIALLVMATCSSIILSWFHMLLLNLALIGGLAGIGLAHLRGNILLKVLPAAVIADSAGAYSSDLPPPSHSNTMHQFKEILYLADAVILAIARMIEKFYCVLKWDDFNNSVRCYVTATLMVVLFHILPFKYTVALCVDAFVIYYPIKTYISEKYFGVTDIEDVVLSHVTQTDPDSISISQASLPSEEEEIEDDVSSEKSESSQEAGSDAEGIEFGEEQDQEIQREEEETEQNASSDGESHSSVRYRETGQIKQSTSQQRLENAGKMEGKQHRPDSLLSSDSGDGLGSENTSPELSKSTTVTGGGGGQKHTGVVGRLIEFKRKQQQANTGTCVGCGVSFSTILKRKKNCANCGNCFCSKCCSYKVAKSLLGVTSPAQTDQVVVCTDCYGSMGSLDTAIGSDLSKLKSA